MSADDIGAAPMLEVSDLRVTYKTARGTHAVLRGVDFAIARGHTLGLVGETGSGKSVLAMAVMRLLGDRGQIVGGDVVFAGRSVLGLSDAALRGMRGKDMSLIMQNARTALDPLARVGRQIESVYRVHTGASAGEARERVLDMLARVQLADPERVAEARADELSGGMAQRVCIAMALVCSPKVLIADNPTSGLDVTVQAQILDLLAGLAAESGLSTLVATSDLGIVAQYCDEVAVLYSGQVVEYGDVQQFFRDARHPYSLSLIGAASYRSTARLGAGESQSDSSGDISDACQYRLRCPAASMRCAVESPLLTPVHDSQKVRCHHSRETRGLIDGTAD